MRFYLLDFQHIGADFVPVKPLSLNSKKFLAYGILLYRGEEIKVKLSVGRFGAPMIKAIAFSKDAGDVSAAKEALDNYYKMKDFYKEAISRNINGLRKRVLMRRIGTFLYTLEQLLFVLCMAFCISHFVMKPTALSLIVFFVSLLLSRLLYVKKWKCIPYGKEFRDVGEE